MIDLTKILKNCPKGWKFYSSIYGDVTFSKIDNSDYPIKFLYFHKDGVEGHGNVTKEGVHINLYNGECTFFPSKDQRDWNKFSAPWFKSNTSIIKKEKFDPKTLQPFDKILVRDEEHQQWKCNFFSHIHKDVSYPYVATNLGYVYCIPYNDETKHLVGTTDEAPEYYRYWEN